MQSLGATSQLVLLYSAVSLVGLRGAVREERKFIDYFWKGTYVWLLGLIAAVTGYLLGGVASDLADARHERRSVVHLLTNLCLQVCESRPGGAVQHGR